MVYLKCVEKVANSLWCSLLYVWFSHWYSAKQETDLLWTYYVDVWEQYFYLLIKSYLLIILINWWRLKIRFCVCEERLCKNELPYLQQSGGFSTLITRLTTELIKLSKLLRHLKFWLVIYYKCGIIAFIWRNKIQI